MDGIAQSRRPAATGHNLRRLSNRRRAEKRLAGRIRIDSVVPILRRFQSLHGRMGRRLMPSIPQARFFPATPPNYSWLTFELCLQTLSRSGGILPRSNAFAEKSDAGTCRTCDRRTRFRRMPCRRCSHRRRHGNGSRMLLALHTHIESAWPRQSNSAFSTVSPRRSCNSSGPKISGTTAPIR